MCEKITSIINYIKCLEKYTGQTVIFRGADCKWKMLTTITRSFFYRHWMEAGYCTDKKRLESEREEWFENGVPKYFKCELQEYEKTIFDSFKRQALHYLASRPKNQWKWLAVAQHNVLPTRLLDWTKNPLVAAYFAVAGNQRIAAQQSVFTVHHPLINITKKAVGCEKFTFDGTKRLEMRKQLHRLGVNGATLFPDLVSFCRNQKWVWEEYRVRSA